MEEVENKWNTLKMNDDIWAKLIYFERNRRLAKAYVSAPVLNIDGSTNGLDGFRIGLSGIENDYRSLDSMGCLRSIGRGVKLKIDSQGNILIQRNINSKRAESQCSVLIKSWAPASRDQNSSEQKRDRATRIKASNLASADTCTIFELDDRSDMGYKLFDMRKFRSNLESMGNEMEFDELDRPLFDWRYCISIISFVRPNIDAERGSILQDPCWLMIINIIAIDMLKNLFCDEMGARALRRSAILMRNYHDSQQDLETQTRLVRPHRNSKELPEERTEGSDTRVSLDERVRCIKRLSSSIATNKRDSEEPKFSSQRSNDADVNTTIYTTFNSKFINRSKTSENNTLGQSFELGLARAKYRIQGRPNDWSAVSPKHVNHLSQSNADLSLRRLANGSLIPSAFRMNYGDEETKSDGNEEKSNEPKIRACDKVEESKHNQVDKNDPDKTANLRAKQKISRASLDSSGASTSSSGCIESCDYFLNGNLSSSMSSSTTSNNGTQQSSFPSENFNKMNVGDPSQVSAGKAGSSSSGIAGATSSSSSEGFPDTETNQNRSFGTSRDSKGFGNDATESKKTNKKLVRRSDCKIEEDQYQRRGYRLKRIIDSRTGQLSSPSSDSVSSIADGVCCQAPSMVSPCCCGCNSMASNAFGRLSGSTSALHSDCDQCRNGYELFGNSMNCCDDVRLNIGARKWARKDIRVGEKRRQTGQTNGKPSIRQLQERSKSPVNPRQSQPSAGQTNSSRSKDDGTKDVSSSHIQLTDVHVNESPSFEESGSNCRWLDRRRKYGKIISKFIYPFHQSNGASNRQQQVSRRDMREKALTNKREDQFLLDTDGMRCDEKSYARSKYLDKSFSQMDLSGECMQY